MRDDDESFYVSFEQLLRLLELKIVAAVRVFQNNIGAEFLSAFLEGLKIGLPALDFERIHKKADLGFIGLSVCAGHKEQRNARSNENKIEMDPERREHLHLLANVNGM
jgi:hypothetical protein